MNSAVAGKEKACEEKWGSHSGVGVDRGESKQTPKLAQGSVPRTMVSWRVKEQHANLQDNLFELKNNSCHFLTPSLTYDISQV